MTALRTDRTSSWEATHRAATAPVPVHPLEYACWLLLALGAIMGGLSFFSWRDGALALLALPVLLLALWPWPPQRPDRALRHRTAAALMLAALPLIYLLPLPLELAAHLPGRTVRLQAAIEELGPAAWTTVSLAADDTWQAWLKLVPGLALFLAALRLPDTRQRRLLGAILAIVMLQALWGLAQVSGDTDSSLLFYGAADDHRASGSFANRNHFASLLLLGLPLLAVLSAGGGWDWRQAPQAGWRLMGATGLLLVTTALLASRSRAAAGLLVLEAGLFCLWLLRRRGLSPRLLGGGLALGLAAGLYFAAYLVPGGLELDSADGRLGVLQRSLTAALAFFPLGAGPGTFGSVFPGFDTLATLDKVYINHAHNDLLELLFELGMVGAALYAGALGLLAAALWRHVVRRGGDAVEWACVLGLCAVAAHGAVDYPLRVPLVAMVTLTFLGVVLRPAATPPPRRNGVDARAASAKAWPWPTQAGPGPRSAP
ncbi:O-antigen ligase family protein [Tahibacter harae]|uniref:O-antigen ligase family protein n=1 Tax=Tahibacter harae TaxID=2963937 RepID=A0ABT1QT47_9GAMM|nr:O-antigen ligase family protein [Tahibacter harae]MCQ4165472.1 O-antigen ligase family protein [Tahibacter harae]